MWDRYKKPPNYKPPQSAEELLERCAKGERYFAGAHLIGADLSDAQLIDAQLFDANLSNAYLTDATLTGANLSGATLTHTTLNNADLRGTILVDANLSNAIFTEANLSYATLTGAILAQAYLANAKLVCSTLEFVDMSDAHLTGANFGSAVLRYTNLANVDLKCLCEASPPVIHKGPSTVDHNSVIRSIYSPHLKDFLVRAGMHDYLAELLIEYAKSYRGSLFTMMRSTFVSYGAPDEAFARKLYEELYRNGVTTFLFSEHAEPGERLHRMMRKGVNEHDRVVLICSRASLDRKGVMNEIEETLAREARDGGETYLVPIRLDDYVFTGWKPKREDIAQAIRDRVVADFEGADKDDAKFTRELGRLLKALRKPSGAGASGAGGP